MKNIFYKIKLLNTSQAIIIAAILISLTLIILDNSKNIVNIFCGEDCRQTKLKNSQSCSRLVAKRTRPDITAKIKNDMYIKCLSTKK